MEEQLTTHQPRVSASKTELERQYTFFAMLWAIASILIAWHRRELAFLSPASATIQAGIAITAFAVLIRPRWTISFMLVSLLHVVHGLAEMPALSTTDLMWLFFGATACVSFTSGWIRHRSHSISAVGLYRSFAPCLRVMFVLSLIAIGVARLNLSFISPETSPVASTLSHLRGDAAAPEWVSYLTMSMLLVVDLFLAVALLMPSLRRFAVGFGSCYFAWAALIGFGETQAMLPLMILGLYLFTSTELVGRMDKTLERWIPFRAVRSAGLAVITVVVAIAAVGLWYQERSGGDSFVVTTAQLVGGCYAGFVAFWLLVLLSGMIDERPRLTWVSLVVRNPAHYVLLALLFLLAISPYIGFGSQGRFVGFSGLSTAGGANNHLLIPQTYLADYEQGLVEIIESNDLYLQSLADQGLLITWFELVNYVEPRPSTSLLFIRNNEQFEVKRAGEITELSTKNTWLERKLLAFQLVDQLAQVSQPRIQIGEHP